ncbi:MAG TPA: M48 family metallopeptidase, partial [Burkholderiales bacterium]|nr:M48 family metallopeptidase [Burkholderiales bacterium]
MNTFTLVFLAALALSLGTRLWLARRHIRHVLAHRERVPDAFAEAISLESHRKAADYTAARTRLMSAHAAFDALVLLALTLGGGLQAIWNLWAGILDADLATGIAFIVSVTALMSALDIPFGLWRAFVLEARFGFNKMTLGTFFSDMAKQAAVGAALGIPLLGLVLWLMGRAGELWWLYAWLAWVGFNLFLLAVYPSWIAPLFNKFTPLEEGELKQRIERLLARCGFASRGLFVMDGSRRSSHGNAYFTGFGRTKRIVFFDTLITRLEGPEIEAVLAHELGHFKLRHVVKRTTLTFLLSLGFLWLLGQAMQQQWFYGGLGVTTPSTAMALQ